MSVTSSSLSNPRTRRLRRAHLPVVGAALCSALLACGPAPLPGAPPPPVPTVAAPRAPTGPAILFPGTPPSQGAAPTDPFARPGVVAPSNESLAGWFEPPLANDPPHLGARTVTAGRRAAIVRRGSAMYAAHLDRGVTGPLAIPEGAFWLGLDAADALYAARPDGVLLRARDLGKALDPGGFEPIVTIPSAVAWDVTEGMIVAAGGPFVIVSTDGGASFRASPLPARQVAAQVVARPDGTVVVVAHEDGDARRRSLWISGDRGATFRASSFRPQSIRRTGARIAGQTAGCEPILSSDGATWGVDDAAWSYVFQGPWESMLGGSGNATGRIQDRRLTLRDPEAPPPPPPAKQIGSDGACPAKPKVIAGALVGVLGGGGSALGIGGIGWGGGRAGALRLRDTSPPAPEASRTQWAFLGDGTCDPADLDTRWKGSTTCRRDRPLTRAPRVARTDARTLALDVVDLPPGCVPEQIFSVRGTAVLLCAKGPGEHALHLAGRDARWYSEGSLACAKDLRLFDAQPDGTFALECAYSSDPAHALWVRRPASLGSAGAFRKVVIEDAVSYRLLDDGRVAAVTSRGKEGPLGGLGGGLGLGSLGGSGKLHGTGTLGLGKGGAIGAGGSGKTDKDKIKDKDKTKDKTKDKGAKPGKAPSASPAKAKEDAAAERARHTFSVTLEGPDGARSLLARDVYTPDDLVAFATSGDSLYFRVEGTSPARAVRYAVLDHGKLVTAREGDVPRQIRPPPHPEQSSGHSFSFAMAAPGGLAADAGHVYFADTEYGQILRAPRGGGKAEVLASGLVSPLAVAVDEARVIFTTLGKSYGDAGTVAFVPKTGGAVTVLAEGQLRPVAVAVDTAAVYWLSQGLERSATGAIHRFPKDGSAPSLVLDRLAGPEAMALAGGRLFAGTGLGEVVSVATAGGPRTRHGARGGEVNALAVAGGRLFWAPGDEPAIASVPLAGGAVTLAALSPFAVTSLAASGEDLWLAATADNVVERLVNGSDRAEIALDDDLAGPSSVLADDTGIYVRDRGGARLRRFPKGAGAALVLYERAPEPD